MRQFRQRYDTLESLIGRYANKKKGSKRRLEQMLKSFDLAKKLDMSNDLPGLPDPNYIEMVKRTNPDDMKDISWKLRGPISEKDFNEWKQSYGKRFKMDAMLFVKQCITTYNRQLEYVSYKLDQRR